MDLFLFYKICKYTQPENTKYCRAFSSGAVTACFYDLGLSRPSACAVNALTHCATASVHEDWDNKLIFFIQSLFSLPAEDHHGHIGKAWAVECFWPWILHNKPFPLFPKPAQNER